MQAFDILILFTIGQLSMSTESVIGPSDLGRKHQELPLEKLIPEVFLLGINRTPIHYRVHSNVQALTASNLWDWDYGSKACTCLPVHHQQW